MNSVIKSKKRIKHPRLRSYAYFVDYDGVEHLYIHEKCTKDLAKWLRSAADYIEKKKK